MRKTTTGRQATLRDIMEREPGIQTDYLKVSEGGVYVKPTLVQTILGSCLAGLFYAPSRGVGAIFHAFLPYSSCYDFAPGDDYKFVDTAISRVMRTFGALGILPGQVQVKLAGGANGIVGESAGVGTKNVEAAYAILDEMRLRVVSADVGGVRGRKLFYVTSTGELYVSYLRSRDELNCPEPRRPR